MPKFPTIPTKFVHSNIKLNQLHIERIRRDMQEALFLPDKFFISQDVGVGTSRTAFALYSGGHGAGKSTMAYLKYLEHVGCLGVCQPARPEVLRKHVNSTIVKPLALPEPKGDNK